MFKLIQVIYPDAYNILYSFDNLHWEWEGQGFIPTATLYSSYLSGRILLLLLLLRARWNVYTETKT